MMKVLIADDEHMICEWLQFCIAQNPDCTLVGVANNGREALELFEQKEPDLVLTDIKMPVMDGLELLCEIRKRSETALVVILTAFSDFELARDALRSGANEYMLKTEMQNKSFQALLSRLSRTVFAACAGSAGQNDLQSAQSHAMARDILLRHGVLDDAALDALRRCGIAWKNNCLFSLAVWKHQSDTLVLPTAEEVKTIAVFDYTARIYSIVANVPGAVSLVEQARSVLDYAAQLQRQNNCMVGVSTVIDHMRHSNDAIRQAAFTLAQGFYAPENRLFEPQCSYAEYSSAIAQWKGEMQSLKHNLYKLTALQKKQAVAAAVKQAERTRVADIELLSLTFCELLEAAFYFSNESSGAPWNEQAVAAIKSSQSMRELTGLVLECAAACCPDQSHVQRGKSKAVTLAQEYIRTHYASQISLEQTASEVYLNAEYFSRIFKEEMGCTFITYLTETRLSRSVQLLETTAMRVQNIAQAVGYANVSHFSTVFKKKYGVSPYEFRHQSGTE